MNDDHLKVQNLAYPLKLGFLKLRSLRFQLSTFRTVLQCRKISKSHKFGEVESAQAHRCWCLWICDSIKIKISSISYWYFTILCKYPLLWPAQKILKEIMSISIINILASFFLIILVCICKHDYKVVKIKYKKKSWSNYNYYFKSKISVRIDLQKYH